MCCMWSTNDPPDIIEKIDPICDIEDAFDIQISDDEALDAVVTLSRAEGIIPALESAHAVAEAIKLAPKMGKDKIILVNLSGRGDKDCNEIASILEKRGK